ncbi:NAD(P)/FAD-dependent oxidoreductase [Streptomyces sp. Ac-502]|uniref:NAD(P)/FAD-dependent oxidoreductase n=1 Tax=Streptomyces sp. Ac-502 TaxID=3342801 RepID=UPI002203B8F4|nr:L-lysine 6-monooxygenase [Streptomyces tumemacerans]
MRICVVGAGVAGALLAWRLAAEHGVRVTLLTGAPRPDATAASGGLVRAFERDPEVARLAASSLAELRASRTLRKWSAYRPGTSLYVLAPADGDGHDAVPDALPPTAERCDRRRLADEFGVQGLPEGAAGVLEPHAGHLSPDGLRRAAVIDLVARGAEVPSGRLRAVAFDGPEGGVTYRTATQEGTADVLVAATGAWTGRLLRSLGVTAGDTVRTKVVQCAVYRAGGLLPPAFVDETSGLYGRPAGPGRMLLGLPTERWGAEPGAARFLDHEERAVRAAAARRLPGLSLGRLMRPVAAVDAYGPAGRLTLEPVLGAPGRLFTFTGGSGGSAKLALAASREAASGLLAGLSSGTSRTGRAPITTITRRETS